VRRAIATGISFGLTSGVITARSDRELHSGTHSTLAVTGGVLTIAVADALSVAPATTSPRSQTRDAQRAMSGRRRGHLVASMALSLLLPLLVFTLIARFASIVWARCWLTGAAGQAAAVARDRRAPADRRDRGRDHPPACGWRRCPAHDAPFATLGSTLAPDQTVPAGSGLVLFRSGTNW
jgi:hypothetical protein